MAITALTETIYTGLSGDSKPTGRQGDRFYETDTGDWFIFNSSGSWVAYTSGDFTLGAGTDLVGRVSASPETSTIYNATTALTPKFAVIAAATSGNNTIVAAVTDKKIRVHALFIVAAAAVTVRFEDGAGGTARTGQMDLAANGGFVLPFNPAGWFETSASTLLNLELSGAISVGGSLTYTEV